MEAYTRDPEEWRRHVAAASKTLDQFSKIFGAEGGVETKSKKDSKRNKQGGREEKGQGADKLMVTVGGEGTVESRGEEEGGGKKGKKRKKERSENEVTLGDLLAHGVDEEGTGGRKCAAGAAGQEEVGEDPVAASAEAGVSSAVEKRKKVKQEKRQHIQQDDNLPSGEKARKAGKKRT